jgi:hypothetical protein
METRDGLRMSEKAGEDVLRILALDRALALDLLALREIKSMSMSKKRLSDQQCLLSHRLLTRSP